MHRFFTHEIYVQFYKNNEKEKNEIENEVYYIDRSYKKKNQKCVIVIAFFDHATRINMNHLNRVFHVKKNVSYMRKSIVNQSIIHFKKGLIQSKNLKINIFIYESDQISIKMCNTESLNTKAKMLIKQLNFSIH